MSSPYCATWNKGVRLLSVLKLWPIVDTSVMSENDDITVRQTVAHTITTVATWARYAMCFTPFEKKGTIIRSVSKPSCSNSGAGPYDTITTGPRWEVYNARWELNKYTSYIYPQLILGCRYPSFRLYASRCQCLTLSAYHAGHLSCCHVSSCLSVTLSCVTLSILNSFEVFFV